jgi:hypothetical protein
MTPDQEEMTLGQSITVWSCRIIIVLMALIFIFKDILMELVIIYPIPGVTV